MRNIVGRIIGGGAAMMVHHLLFTFALVHQIRSLGLDLVVRPAAPVSASGNLEMVESKIILKTRFP